MGARKRRGVVQKKKLKDQELAHLCSTLCQEEKQEKKRQATGDAEEEQGMYNNAASKRFNKQRRGTGKGHAAHSDIYQ